MLAAGKVDREHPLMSSATRTSPRAHRWWIRGATALFLAGVVALGVMILPRGFDTDLSQIGKGKAALVFVYDPNLVVSNEQTREMDKAREILGDDLHFLVADIGRPAAQQFMDQHRAKATQLLLFAADGQMLGRMQGLMTAEELVAVIEGALTPQ
jgi:hypothetical protein